MSSLLKDDLEGHIINSLLIAYHKCFRFSITNPCGIWFPPPLIITATSDHITQNVKNYRISIGTKEVTKREAK